MRDAAARRARARTVCRSRKLVASRAGAASSACATTRSVARPARSIAAAAQNDAQREQQGGVEPTLRVACDRRAQRARKERQQLEQVRPYGPVVRSVALVRAAGTALLALAPPEPLWRGFPARRCYRLCSSQACARVALRAMADAPEQGGGEGDEGAGGSAVFFKRRVARGNLRKRAADEDGEGGAGGEGGEAPAVVRPAPKARREGALGGSTASRDGDAKPVFAYEADRQRQAAGDGGATATLETETPFDRDARAAREAVLAQASRLGPDGREVDDGLYHGANAYIDYRKGFRREHNAGSEKASGTHGPLRAPTNVRFTFIMDYKPDICKDYKETGYCGYGDSCKFMHDRGDYKAGWQLDREWDDKEQARKAREAAALAGMLAEVEGGEAAKEEEAEDDLPFACFICRRTWADARDPVVTRCKHYFCEQCALQHNSKNKTCAQCMVRRPPPQRDASADLRARSNPRTACSTRRTTSCDGCATPRTVPRRSAQPRAARRAPPSRKRSLRGAAQPAGCSDRR